MGNTAISITAIVVSGVVGPAVSAWWIRRTREDEHQRELRAELRVVLDEAANALGLAKRCYERIYVLHRDGVDRESQEAREAFAGRRKAMQEVRYADDRIAIRLGTDHVVHRCFSACMKTLDEQREFARAYEKGSAIERPLAKQRRAHEAFRPARRAFVDAAREVIGAPQA
jgi:hypothetical protein